VIIRVVAAAIIVENELLLVSKQPAPCVFYLPGGKPERGEEPLAALTRELDEELGVRVVSATPLLGVQAPAALEDARLQMELFLTEIDGVPAAGAEIAEIAWWPSRTVHLAPAVADGAIPALQLMGLLDYGGTSERASPR
jgi:8-oxo-dGTP pyrophosphatase MutT (NUDIX family)